ncbi:group II truncated hemoglobin [Rhizorhapis sp. SPR117]|nr:group II truncated hemoglobin [Rhizorhapis sp. SPR117]
MIGGEAQVRRFVDRFYDLMDSDPDYSTLRALHAEDLEPMRASLADFLIAWLGGPRRWFEERPGACIMSAHGKLTISRAAAEQWTHAMARALADSDVDPVLASRMGEAFSGMARAMINC